MASRVRQEEKLGQGIREGTADLSQSVVAALLLVLLMALWAWLWVRPLPTL